MNPHPDPGGAAKRACPNCKATYPAPLDGGRSDCPKCGCCYPVEVFAPGHVSPPLRCRGCGAMRSASCGAFHRAILANLIGWTLPPELR
jgi:hypothetical protein